MLKKNKGNIAFLLLRNKNITAFLLFYMLSLFLEDQSMNDLISDKSEKISLLKFLKDNQVKYISERLKSPKKEARIDVWCGAS